MTRITRTQWGAFGMALLLVLYLVFVAIYAARLVGDPQPVAQAMGWALIVLPLIGGWALWAEFVFGFRVDKLARTLESEGGMPSDEIPARESGRLERDAADEIFARYAAEVETHPESWRHWFRLGLAYDASRDRRRARWAMRTAILLWRADPA